MTTESLMTAFRRFWHRVSSFFRRRSVDSDLSREIASHLALLEDDFQRRGFSAGDARLAARRALGSTAHTADLHRDAGSLVWIDDLRRDLQYALRALRREPGFAVVVALTLALGIGANTAIFSVVHSVLLRPLPYKDSMRLVRVWDNVPASEMPNRKPFRYGAMDMRDLLDVSGRSQTLTHLVSYSQSQPTTTIDGDATRMDGFSVSAGFFQMLGVQALVGRTFGDEEFTTGHDHVVVLGYGAWRRFGGDPHVLGRVVTFGGDPTSPFVGSIAVGVGYTVVGVMPPGFRFPYDNAQFWVPRVLTRPPAGGRPVRRATIARVATGATSDMAAAEIAAIRRAARGSSAAASSATGPRFELIPLYDELTGPVKPALLVLTAAVGIVLLIACVNVANLLLARTASRQREIAVRVAIGAGRGRLVRQLLAESLLLAGLGGVAGTALAFGGVRLFRVLGTTLGRVDLGATSVFPRLGEVTVDATVLGYALALSLGTGIVFGLVPALRHSQPQQAEFLRETTTSARTGLKNALVVAEMALATVLFVGGGLLINSFVKLATVDPGFDPSQLLTFQVSMSGSHRPGELQAFAESLAERLRSTPGVQSAAYARQLPMVQLQDSITLTRRRDGVDRVLGEAQDIRFVSRDYLKTMGVRVLSGRGFGENDGPGRPGVVLINEAMARRDFPGESPLGQTVFFGRQRSIALEIVGVVANVRQFGLDREPQPQYFLDYRKVAFWIGESNDPPLFPVGAYYSVRTAADNTAAVLGGIRSAVRQLDDHASIDNVATMEQIVSNSISRPRMYAVLVAIFSGVAVALAAIGLYGVMAYTVAQRTREIGIRMALGAQRVEVMRLVLRQSTMLVAAGLLCGLAGAAAVTRYLEGLLFGLTPLDPATFFVVALTFAGVATLASYVPARRAASVDPLVALRYE
jgi:predicted permease